MKTINCLALGTPLALVAAPALTAQEVLNWGDFELCGDCRFEMDELVRLGDRDGPGIIESEMMQATWDEELGYLLYPLGGTGIKIFDHDGTFKREIGREGDNLRERRHLGRYVWDPMAVSILDRGGEPAVYLLEYDNAMVPRIVVYGAGPARP